MPLLDRTVPAERVGVVQQGRPHPLQALQVRNDTGTSLPAGILTLYDPTDAATFAGDARLGGLPAGETRLLEFAEDLRTGVDWRSDGAMSLIGVTAAQGVLTLQQRQRWTAHVTLTAPPGESRHLLLEIPRRGPEATLSVEGELKPSGQTASAWRVPLTLKPGESREVVAHVDVIQREQTALLDNDAVLAEVLGSQALSEPARAALRHIGELRAALATREQARDRLRTQQDAVNKDEDRLRRNLAVVAASDALHGRLSRALEADEDRIAALGASIADADTATAAARSALEQAVQALKL
jgi:hypothetical protein